MSPDWSRAVRTWLDTPRPVMFPESFMISARPADRELTVMSPEWSAIVALPEIRVAWMSPESVLSMTVHPDVHHHDVGLVGSDLAQELLGIPRRRLDLVAGVGEQPGQALTHQHRVFGDHYPAWQHHLDHGGPPVGRQIERRSVASARIASRWAAVKVGGCSGVERWQSPASRPVSASAPPSRVQAAESGTR